MTHDPRPNDSRCTLVHFTDAGDTSGYFEQLAKHHDRGRYRMILATLKPIEPQLRAAVEEQGVRSLSLGCRTRWAYPLAAARLAAFLRRERVEILHTHLFDPSVVGQCAGMLARTPLRLLTRHYSDYHTRIDKLWHVRLDRLCTFLANAVIAVSGHTADHMVRMEGAPPRKVHVVLNGIDLDRVRPPSDADVVARRHEFAPNGEYLLLTPARLHPEKGHDCVFDALVRLRAELPRPVVLLVAGTGPYEARYRHRVQQLGCEGAVRFLGFRRDIPALMRAADLVVLPSVVEAFGLVLAEALHLGVPVVASRVGGIPEIVEDGTNGLLVPPGDSVGLAEAIRTLLTDPRRRREMASRGHDKVVQQFRFERMMRAYEAIYEELRAGKRSAC